MPRLLLKTALLVVILHFSTAVSSQEKRYYRTFFDNSLMPESWYYSKMEVTAPSVLVDKKGKWPVSNVESPTPGNALQLKYVSKRGGSWKAVLNFAELRGKDFFYPATHLSFWIYADEKTAVHVLPKIGLSADSVSGRNVSVQKYLPVLTPKKWLHVLVPLTDFGMDAEKVRQVIFSQAEAGSASLFIDQVELILPVKNAGLAQVPALLHVKAYERHVDVFWKPDTSLQTRFVKIYRSENGGNYKPVGVHDAALGLFTDYTGQVGKTYRYKLTAVNRLWKESGFSPVKSAQTKMMTDEELLTMVQEAGFRYYWNSAEPNNGLALENIAGRRNMIATGASGFGLMALIVGAERKFITQNELVLRFEKILTFLEKADRFHGAYPHFLDGRTGKTIAFFGSKDNGADLVETSFLMQGLLASRQYFDPKKPLQNELINRITKLWEAVEWSWFRREKDSNYLYWHWSPDQAWVINHRLIGFNETMITYLLAIASPTHGVPANLYYSGFASQEKFAQDYRKNWGETSDGSLYKNGQIYQGIKLDVGVGQGGPLFFTHYSYLGFDPHKLGDRYTPDYFLNNKNIALINYKYCVANPEKHPAYGADFWGLTASDGPEHYSAKEPNERLDDGTMAPTGAISSFPYTPQQSMAALKNMYRNYGQFLWGEYGFRDAINLEQNWASPIFMGLNQAPQTVMIENYRSGLIWKLFMSNPEIKKMTTAVFNPQNVKQ